MLTIVPPDTAAVVQPSPTLKRAVSGTKEVFTGVRRIWGTMTLCTVPTVIKSITQLTSIGSNVQVKIGSTNQ